MTPVTDPRPGLDLDAILARAEAATAGPWMAASANRRKDGVALVGAGVDRGTGRAIAVLAGVNVKQRHRDAQFIAHARTDVPALVAEIRRLRLAQTTLTVGLNESGRYSEWARGELDRLREEIHLLRNPTTTNMSWHVEGTVTTGTGEIV